MYLAYKRIRLDDIDINTYLPKSFIRRLSYLDNDIIINGDDVNGKLTEIYLSKLNWSEQNILSINHLKIMCDIFKTPQWLPEVCLIKQTCYYKNSRSMEEPENDNQLNDWNNIKPPKSFWKICQTCYDDCKQNTNYIYMYNTTEFVVDDVEYLWMYMRDNLNWCELCCRHLFTLHLAEVYDLEYYYCNSFYITNH
nr:hypothetical protein Datr000041 [Darna trima granulovirus]